MPKEEGYILIVDDVQAILEVVDKMLREKNYETACAISGEQALAQARARPPELILLDVNMPGLNGYEVCNKLKEDERTRDIPVIFLTGKSEIKDMDRGYDVGGTDYVTKPFDVSQLLHRIETSLKLSRIQKAVSETKKKLSDSRPES